MALCQLPTVNCGLSTADWRSLGEPIAYATFAYSPLKIRSYAPD